MMVVVVIMVMMIVGMAVVMVVCIWCYIWFIGCFRPKKYWKVINLFLANFH